MFSASFSPIHSPVAARAAEAKHQRERIQEGHHRQLRQESKRTFDQAKSHPAQATQQTSQQRRPHEQPDMPEQSGMHDFAFASLTDFRTT
jgi:hypothetical protein